MSSEQYKSIIQGFHQRIFKALGYVQTDYFVPPPQNIHIYIGQGDIKVFEAVRAQTEPGIFVMYLYPADSGLSEEQFYNSRPEGELTLFSTIGSENSYVNDKISLLIEFLCSRNVKFSIFTELQETYKDETQEVLKIIDISRNNVMLSWISNINRLRCAIQNIPMISRDRQYTYPRVPSGIGAIIVSAGPSLASQMELLRQYQDKFIVIAVGHTVTTFDRFEMTPDYIVELDPTCYYYNWQHDIHPKAPLVSCANVSPQVAGRFEKIIWCQSDSLAFNSIIRDMGYDLSKLSFSQTVTVTAIDLAVKMGCEKIALIGNDLCLSDTGALHVDAYKFNSGEELLEVPGNDGQPVKTVSHFHGLRIAIERYIENLLKNKKDDPNFNIFNCTAGGAVIDHAARIDFIDYCEKFQSDFKKPEIVVRQNRPEAKFTLQNMHNDLRTYINIVKELITCAVELLPELEQFELDMDKVQEKQEQMRLITSKEAETRQLTTLSNLLTPIYAKVDDILNELPGDPPAANDPSGQVRSFLMRYNLILDLCGDISEDLSYADSSAKDGEVDFLRKPDPFFFNSFRNYAIARIRIGNPELADFLTRINYQDEVPGFKILVMFQYLSFVHYQRPDGSWYRLSNEITMEEQARKEISQFVEDTKFDQENDRIVFLGAGNWSHPAEFGRIYPKSEYMIVEPWPRVLAKVIYMGMFFHFMPESSVVIGMDHELESWREVYKQKLQQWHGENKRILFFKHPRIWDLPEGKDFFKDLPKL